MTTDWDAPGYESRGAFVWEMPADLLDLLGPAADERILDVGCGTGHLAARIAECGADVLGIDASPSMVELARRNYPGLRFELLDVLEMRFPSEFDAVFSNAALHWMKEAPAEVIACVARALRPGGRFVAEMGAHRNVRIITDALYRALAEEGVPADAVDFPWYFPRTSHYVGLLEDGGFDVTQLYYFARPTPLDDCPNGLADWIVMFGRNFTDAAPPGRAQAVVNRTIELTRDRLCPDGRWITDYTRLRFVAVRVSDG